LRKFQNPKHVGITHPHQPTPKQQKKMARKPANERLLVQYYYYELFPTKDQTKHIWQNQEKKQK
jgi:hypothetical protein